MTQSEEGALIVARLRLGGGSQASEEAGGLAGAGAGAGAGLGWAGLGWAGRGGWQTGAVTAPAAAGLAA